MPQMDPRTLLHLGWSTNGWTPATLQLLEGSSYFVEHHSMATAERIKFFTQYIEQSSNIRSIYQ